MLFFTRWKAAAILLTALVVCLCALPNFFSDSVIRHWPSWAQRHIVLGLDLQGGSHLLLEVGHRRQHEILLALGGEIDVALGGIELSACAHTRYRPASMGGK